MSIVPVLLGGDLNAYSVALSFFNKYSVLSHAFMRYRCGATDNSKFIKTHLCSGLDDSKIAMPELLKFARAHSTDELFLVPCSDSYVSLLEAERDVLSRYYSMHIPTREHFRILGDKGSFYKVIDKKGIPYPKTEILRFGENPENKFGSFDGKVVVKPSSSSEYWKHPFFDMQKVYFPKNKEEAQKAVNDIFLSGYRKEIILQERIVRATDRVLTTFSDNRGRVSRAVYGEVILEESGKTSQGNHSAIISLPLDDICFSLVDFLNEIGYKGFANFDVLSTGKEKYVLEVNLRQGRSSDYLRGADVNIAELLVENKRYGKVNIDFSYKEFYWHYPKHIDVMRYSENEWGKRRADLLYEAGKSISPYRNKEEGTVRKLYVMIHNYRLGKALRQQYLERREV